MCAKIKFVQFCYSHRGAPLYSGTPAPSSGLVKAYFYVSYDFYNRLQRRIIRRIQTNKTITAATLKPAAAVAAYIITRADFGMSNRFVCE